MNSSSSKPGKIFLLSLVLFKQGLLKKLESFERLCFVISKCSLSKKLKKAFSLKRLFGTRIQDYPFFKRDFFIRLERSSKGQPSYIMSLPIIKSNLISNFSYSLQSKFIMEDVLPTTLFIFMLYNAFSRISFL